MPAELAHFTPAQGTADVPFLALRTWRVAASKPTCSPCGITTWAALSSCGERSVDEIAPHLPATELQQTIVLVGRSPRLYARGTLLENKRSTPQPPPAQAAPTNHARLQGREAFAYAGAGKPWGHDAQPPFRTSPGAQRRPPEPIKRGEASGAPADLKTAPWPLQDNFE